MKGKHTGLRMGDGLFALFHSELGVAHHMGPGTGDNASNNLAAADRFSELINSEHDLLTIGGEMIGCLCHIANIAAQDYLASECGSSGRVVVAQHANVC